MAPGWKHLVLQAAVCLQKNITCPQHEKLKHPIAPRVVCFPSLSVCLSLARSHSSPPSAQTCFGLQISVVKARVPSSGVSEGLQLTVLRSFNSTGGAAIHIFLRVCPPCRCSSSQPAHTVVAFICSFAAWMTATAVPLWERGEEYQAHLPPGTERRRPTTSRREAAGTVAGCSRPA